MSSSALSVAASGMNASQRLLDVAAHNVANVSTPGYQSFRPSIEERPGGGVAVTVPAPPANGAPGVDIAEQMVQMITANLGMKANVVSARTATQAYNDILDMGRRP